MLNSFFKNTTNDFWTKNSLLATNTYPLLGQSFTWVKNILSLIEEIARSRKTGGIKFMSIQFFKDYLPFLN